MFHYGFMQRAFWAGSLIAIVAPALGVYLLLRRQALMADTLSHISLAGVAIGTLLGIQPVLGAFMISIAGSLGMEKLRRMYRSYSEVSVAIVMTSGLALALVLMSMNQGLNKGFQAYLFGSIVAISILELILILLVTVAAALVFVLFRRPMYQLTFDEETAQVSGVPVRAISTVFVLLTGMTVAVTMPILGALLVSAMMVLPAALAIRIAKGFTMTIVVAIAVGLIGMWSGLTLSYYLGTPPGGSIALMLVVLLLVGLFAQTKLSTMKRGSTYL